MVEAAVVPPLLRLLASCVLSASELPVAGAAPLAANPAATLGWVAECAASTDAAEEAGTASSVGAPSNGLCSKGSGGSDSASHRAPPAALAYVLRTLVNLTSNPRAAGPVRQAILRDHQALAAVLQLLCVSDLGLEPPCSCEAEPSAPSAVAGVPAGADAAEAARWQLAGLAAWLLAHLCSAPMGQLQLVQEGVIPLLVRLVRQARLAWAATEAVASATRHDGHAVREGLPQQAQLAGGSGTTQAAARTGAGTSLPPRGTAGASSSALLDAAAAAACGGVAAGALPYTLAAMQYALMALVNVTYDNSANQRVAARVGSLEELDALFSALLQPGVLLGPQRPMGRAPPALLATGATAQEAVLQGAMKLGAGSAAGPEGRSEEEEEAERRQQQLLRGCCAGVAKFAVWLLAHISSSDPDLKAAIAGPAFAFVPKLLSFLLAQTQPLQPPVRQPMPANMPPNAASPTAAAAPASPVVVVVQQYAAMALVNLTCGVPATKAAVAGALDWPAMAALLSWLAEEHAAAPAVPHRSPPATADLLLYTVWLVQHLSLSPIAAAAADPRVIPPLVALLAAHDPHVRLRCAAALGALCSCSALAAEHPGSGSTAAAAPPPHPHRAAFHATGGLQHLLEVARAERDPHLLAYEMLCMSSSVGEDDAGAVAAAVGGGALGLLESLLACPHAACLIPAAEALQAFARAARGPTRRASGSDSAAAAVAADVAAAAADHVPRSLLSRVVAVMLTHGDPRVRSALNEALGAVTALPGVRDRYCAVFAETLRELVSAAVVELQVVPVN